MKKLTCVFILFLILFSAGLHSQDIELKAGSVLNYFVSDQQHMRGNTCLAAGAGYYLPFNTGQVKFRIGVEYVQLGGGMVTIEDDTRFGLSYNDVPMPRRTRDASVTLHTVNIPLTADFELVSNANFTVTAGIGPEVSYLLQAISNETVTGELGGDVYGTYSQTVNQTANFETFNYAVSGNVHFEVPFESNSLFIECRYRYGINAVRKGYSYLDIAEIRSDVFQQSVILLLGYKLNFSSSSE